MNMCMMAKSMTEVTGFDCSMLCPCIFRIAVTSNSRAAPSVCYLQTCFLHLFLLTNRKLFCSLGLSAKAFQFVNPWRNLPTTNRCIALCGILQMSSRACARMNEGAAWGQESQEKEETEAKESIQHVLSVMSNHCFSLSCDFNFIHIVRARKTCWIQ